MKNFIILFHKQLYELPSVFHIDICITVMHHALPEKSALHHKRVRVLMFLQSIAYILIPLDSLVSHINEWYDKEREPIPVFVRSIAASSSDSVIIKNHIERRIICRKDNAYRK